MAKSGITNINGGGAIGSDELSVTADKVIEGNTYVGADTNDEIGAGTLVDRPSTVSAQSVAQGLSGSNNYIFTRIPTGAYRTPTGVGYPEITALSSSVATAGGLSADKMLVGKSAFGIYGTATSDATVGGSAHILAGKTAYVNGVKVTGNIPYQNAETGGDRVWATNMNNWAGTINLGVRNGYYLNGVNWIQVNIPEYQPWNIKKGVNMGGQVGTFEGYIANPTDLYYKGINPVGFYSTNENYVIFDAAQITLPDRNMNSDLYIKSSSNVSLVGYSYVNIHYVCTGTAYSYTPTLLFTINNDETLGHNYLSKGDSTLSINVVAYQKNGIVGIRMGKWSGYIDRIWLT